MNCTIKSVNKVFPRLDTLDRDYSLAYYAGHVKSHGCLDCAIADYDDNGQCCGITVYAYGEAKPSDHYYLTGKTVNVTGIVESFMRREYDRKYICAEIARAITEASRKRR